MPVSKHEDKMFSLQSQIRENQVDLTSFLGDLDKWTNDIKQKDESLKKQEPIHEQKLPPVRNSQTKKKKKKLKKKEDSKEDKDKHKTKPKRISSYDYRAWDKFDVDKACDELNDGNDDASTSGLDTDSESDEECERIRAQQLAIEHKNKGNEHFNKGEYEEAVEWYSKGAMSDPTNPLLPGNRAMALLKLERYAAAEEDATQAITLDPLYIKAYLRRATARLGLKNFDMARDDYKRILNLDPKNKTAMTELEKLEKELNRGRKDRAPVSSIDIKDEGIVKPIYKPPEQRSKKPLKRIEIEEIGVEDDSCRKAAIAKTKASQSMTAKQITEKESRQFEQFTSTKTILDDSKKTSEKLTKLKIEEVSSCENVYSVQSEKNKILPETENATKQTASPLSSPRSADPVLSARQKNLPTTSFQFQADYKELKQNPEAFFEYFKRIEPYKYPKLFGESLDADVLINILKVLQRFYLPMQQNFFPHLKYLAEVKRFSMTVMFLSSKDKEVLRELFVSLQDLKMASDAEIYQLKKNYQI